MSEKATSQTKTDRDQKSRHQKSRPDRTENRTEQNRTQQNGHRLQKVGLPEPAAVLQPLPAATKTEGAESAGR